MKREKVEKTVITNNKILKNKKMNKNFKIMLGKLSIYQ